MPLDINFVGRPTLTRYRLLTGSLSPSPPTLSFSLSSLNILSRIMGHYWPARKISFDWGFCWWANSDPLSFPNWVSLSLSLSLSLHPTFYLGSWGTIGLQGKCHLIGGFAGGPIVTRYHFLTGSLSLSLSLTLSLSLHSTYYRGSWGTIGLQGKYHLIGVFVGRPIVTRYRCLTGSFPSLSLSLSLSESN